MFSSNTSQVSTAANYIEDVFSTYLYTGTGATQTITNNVDLSTKGGLVWTKSRSAADDHKLYDTDRGATKYLMSSATNAEITAATSLTAFTTSGFTLGSGTQSNFNARTYASWTFRKQAKFFDIVTYSGTANAFLTVNHNLGSVPGCIITKCITAGSSENWIVYHRSAGTYNGVLNSTGSFGDGPFFDQITSTSFRLTGNSTGVSTSGRSYVAYLFAHNAGGFGTAGTDNVISCGSYTGNGSATGPVITLGYEPQWLMIKNATTSDTGTGWRIFDNMRGIATGGNDAIIFANTTATEVSTDVISLTSTGFSISTTGTGLNSSGDTFIYIAIRRGPMKTPTSATSVFSPQLEGGTVGTKITTGFPIDWQLIKGRSSAQTTYGITRLTGNSSTTTEAAGNLLQTASTAAELADSTATRYWDNTGFQVPSGFGGGSSTFYITENFSRAPGFFDVVCYTGTGANTTINHNLAVAPELMIIKSRSAIGDWPVYVASLGASQYVRLQSTNAAATDTTYFNSTSPTSTVFTIGTSGDTNTSGRTYVAYLFASLAGISKVGSYSGTGATQTISCGFAARFVLIKKTTNNVGGGGGWLMWDTARGMTAGTDPRIELNTATAETNTNWVYTDASGFQIVTTDSSVNAATDSYIYLAIA